MTPQEIKERYKNIKNNSTQDEAKSSENARLQAISNRYNALMNNKINEPAVEQPVIEQPKTVTTNSTNNKNFNYKSNLTANATTQPVQKDNAFYQMGNIANNNTAQLETNNFKSSGNAWNPLEDVIQTPEIMKDNNRRFEDGYQFGDVTKTAVENLGDSVATIGGTAADIGLNVVNGAVKYAEGLAKLPAAAIAQGIDSTQSILNTIGENAGTVGKYASLVTNNPMTSVMGNAIGLASNYASKNIDQEKAHQIATNIRQNIIDDKGAWLSPKIQKATDTVNNASVMGDKFDEINQGIGQLGGLTAMSATLGAAGVPSSIPIKIGSKTLEAPIIAAWSGASSGVDEAYRKGGTDVDSAQVWSKALTSGAAEGISEGIFGMFGVGGVKGQGGKELSDVIISKVVPNISSDVGKFLAKVGISATGEGSEEIISYFLNWIGDNAIVNNLGSTDFSSEFDFKEACHEAAMAFIETAISGGIVSGANISTQLNDTVKTAEKALGRPLTQQETQSVKKQIFDYVLTDGDTKYDPTNETLKAVDKYNYNQQRFEDNPQKDYLERGLLDQQQKNTEIVKNNQQAQNINAPQSLINELQNNTQQVSSLQQENTNMVQNNANIEQQAQNNIENDVKALNLEKDANNSQKSLGLEQQNKVELPEQLKTFVENRNKIAPGLNVQMDDSLADLNVDGVIERHEDGTRTIKVNPYSTRSYEFVTLHEMMHDLENTKEYKELSDFVKARAEGQGGYDKAFNSVKNQYVDYYNKNGLNLDNLNIENETTNDMVARSLGNQDFLNELATEKPTVFKRMYNWIKNVLLDGQNTGKSFSERRADNKYLQELKSKFEKAYNTAYNQENSNKSSFSLTENTTTDNQGRQLSEGQQEYFKDSKVRDGNGNLLEVYHGTPTGGFTVFDKNKIGTATDVAVENGDFGKGFYFTPNKQGAETYTESENVETTNPKVYSVYLNMKNPLRLDVFSKINNDIIKYMRDNKKNVLSMTEEDYQSIYNKYGITEEQYNEMDDIFNKLNENDYYDVDIQSMGYDGVISPGGEQYVVFDPNQIKNVDNLNPTENDDIRYSQANNEWNKYLDENWNLMNKSAENSNNAIAKESQALNLEKDNKQYSIGNTEDETTQMKVAELLKQRPEKAKKTAQQLVIEAQRYLTNKGAMVDKLAKITKNDNLKYTYDKMLSSTNAGNYIVGVKQTDNQGKPIGKSINDIWSPIEKAGKVEDFSMYLLHKLNVERMAQNKPVFGENVTAEDSKRVIEQYEKENPEFINWSNDVYKFNKNQLQNMVDAGLASQETQELLNEMYDHYIRIQRDINGKSFGQAAIIDNKGNLRVNNPIKTAKGGSQDILPLKETMAQQAIEVKRAIARNEFGLELLNTLKNGEEVAEYGEVLSKGKKGEAPSFTVFKDGKAVKMKINDELYNAIKPSQRYEFEDFLFKGVQNATNWFKAVTTGKNPIYSFRNMAKDIQTAEVNSKYSKDMSRIYAELAKLKYDQIYGKVTKKADLSQRDIELMQLWELYKANGGESNTYFDYEKGFDTKSKNKAIKNIQDTVEKVEQINEVIEQMPRVAEFIATLENGGTLNEALYNAADITTNFKRGGEFTKFLDRNGAPFLNASVQGLSKQIRNFTEQKSAEALAKFTIKAALMGIVPAVLNKTIHGDDDDYDDLPNYIKDNYWLFKIGDNKFLRIPKGRDLSSFLGTLTQRTLRLMNGEEDAFDGWLDTFSNNLAPNNPLTDNMVAPWFAVGNNKSWNGSKIVSDSIGNETFPYLEYDAKTTELSKGIARALKDTPIKLSPKKLDYIMDQYTGGIGDVLMPLMTKYADETNPYISSFTTSSITNNKNVSKIYDEKTKLQDSKDAGLASDADLYNLKYINDVTSEMSKLRNKQTEIQLSDMSDKEKKAESNKIQEEINEMAKKANKNIDKYGKTSEKLLKDDAFIQYITSDMTDKDDEAKETRIQKMVKTYTDKEVFGSEYALAEYNKSVSEKQQIASTYGIDADTFFDAYMSQKVKSKKQEKINAIQDGTEKKLTSNELGILYGIFEGTIKSGKN